MTTITPGTGGTLKSTTLENAFHECLVKGLSYELDSTKNPSSIKNITLALDLATNRARGTFSFSFGLELGTTGQMTVTVSEYLTSTGFTSGTGGTVRSNTIASAIVEIAEMLQAKDRLPSKNPSQANTITGLSYDSETLVVTGAFEYGIVTSVEATGNTIISAKNYLLD